MTSMRGLSVLRVLGFMGVLLAVGYGAPAGAVNPIYAGSATAQGTLFNQDAKAPDISSVPALSNLTKGGAKLYYLGERSGLHGWFIVQEGQVQMIYLSPDHKTVIVGAMFSSEGENVTTPQIAALAQTNKDVNDILNGTGQDQKEVLQAGREGGAATVSGSKDPVTSKLSNSLPGVPLSPGERLVQDLKASASVSLGKSDVPELMMVVSPGCGKCKQTWVELRDSVKSGKIQVRLVPIYSSTDGEEKRAAAQILRTEDPLAAWDSFVSGKAEALAGTPDDNAVRAIQANMSLVAKWNIQGTPYLVYRGRDGRVKIVQGRPERMAAVLSDLTK